MREEAEGKYDLSVEVDGGDQAEIIAANIEDRDRALAFASFDLDSIERGRESLQVGG